MTGCRKVIDVLSNKRGTRSMFRSYKICDLTYHEEKNVGKSQ